MRNIFHQIWNKRYSDNSKLDIFKKVIGHYEIKSILIKAIFSKKPVHILLVGRPGTAKTMFLLEINRLIKMSLFIVGSNTTKAGLLNKLFEVKPKFVLVDELEKMNQQDQISLLHLMETGIISETKVNKTRQMELRSHVFATANNYKKVIEPLLSRFVVLEIPQYTYKEFKEIAAVILKREDIDGITAIDIAEKVWNELGSRDIRDTIKVARLCGNDKVHSIISALKIHNKKVSITP